ncbi:NAD-dependent epimerase/dehydratase family protein [Candidatus Woesearchaeota archaeon]|nr:NAD-dependent epimerase/dehydratase family protein [Candidatus Woesearchaeota archaeon]
MLLLTGATGFLGMELLKMLKGKRLRCLVRDVSAASRLEKCGCGLAIGDLSDKGAVSRAVKGVDIIIHAAAVIKARDSADYLRVNVDGTRNLVEAAKSSKVKHFIFLSSVLASYQNTTPYGKSKLAAEEIVRNSGVPFTILRISLIYGEKDTRAIGGLVGFIKRSPVVPILGSGSSPLQPVYVGDAVKAVVAASESRPKGRMYYIAGPAITYRELVKAIVSGLRLKRLLISVPPFALKMALMIFGLLPIKLFKSAFDRSQLDFLSANRVFRCDDAARDFRFSPLAFSEGLKKIIHRKL